MDDPDKKTDPHGNADLFGGNFDYQVNFTPGWQIYQLGQWVVLEVLQGNTKKATRISRRAVRMMERLEATR